ncbi:hypothetical protein KAFR_0D05130 [Kazachstania africana CBS 2517]|uniref:Mitochondrial carrier protein n=1 Tax=Kazachstania africana (strain ATCC 22294 / BCRC 22015 / CBS 2517 / CECT 1963 / NBRC 1671 / NRRL Y-8276) TaxID=1071382 RepID=H2AUW0_KAZAF|nr:hypothetical protein KAFR_0D05130 [Kazachstania africana CBS 2517]CCF58160.1 hypothetical protein KAFR_0D05130 [Kazachstania africana CBS 2517]
MEQAGGGLSSIFWNIINGSIAGAIGKIIEYPFDTVKVRMQTQGSHIFPTTWSCIRYTYENEGIMHGFFQGIESPLIGAALENAMLFVAYNQFSRFLETYTSLSHIIVILLSGAFAGACASLVLTPVELIKCRLQVINLHSALPQDEDEEAPAVNTTILGTIKAILKERGISGFWQGQSGTFIREFFGSLIWFATYAFMKKFWIMENGGSGQIKSWQLLLSGACAGLAFNASIFPADTVKSIMQTERIGLLEAVSKVKNTYGIAGFYRGLGITLFRAVPANAVVFFTYEKLSLFFGQSPVQT